MKPLILFLIISYPLLSFNTNHTDKDYLKNISISKCTGSTPCNACSNCSGCKYCSSGGTCGVCEKKPTYSKPLSSSEKKTSTEYSSGQCQAVTKKGTQCSRKAKSNGYCWQHGG